MQNVNAFLKVMLIFVCVSIPAAGICGCGDDPMRDLRKAASGKPLNHVESYGVGLMPYSEVLNLPTCDVLLNGTRSCRGIVDTGAGNTVIISASMAEELGLAAVVQRHTVGLGGSVKTGLALLDRLTLGEIAVRQVIAQVVSDGTPLLMLGEIVLGTGIFADGRVTLDFEHAELIVDHSSPVSQTGTAVDLKLGAAKHLYGTAEAQGVSARVMFDSGAAMQVYSPAWLDLHHPERVSFTGPLPKFNIVMGVGVTRAPNFTTVDLAFAGRRFDRLAGVEMADLDEGFGEAMQQSLDIILGMTIFRRMKSCTVDFPREKMWISWLDEP